jgi:hypothetical protein
MANLYAQVTTVAINPGFNKVVEVAYVDCSSGDGGFLEAPASAANVIYSKQRTMEDLVAQAEQYCARKEEMEEAEMAQRLAEADAAFREAVRFDGRWGEHLRRLSQSLGLISFGVLGDHMFTYYLVVEEDLSII